MGVGMTKVLHVKIPVTDLQRSADWYAHQNARICRSVLGCRRSVGGPVVRQPTEDTNVAPMWPNVDPQYRPNIDPSAAELSHI